MRSSIFLLLAFAFLPGCNTKEAVTVPAVAAAPDPVAPQIALLSHESADKRKAATLALAILGESAKAAIPALTQLLNDPNDEVRSIAGHALSKIDPEGAANRSTVMQSKMSQIAVAMHAYHDFNGFFPPTCTVATSKDGKIKIPGLSWRVLLLPHLKHDDLFKQFRLEEPWDSEHNKKLIDQMPAIYAPPAGSPAGIAPSETHAQVFYAANPFVLGGTVFPHPYFVVHQNSHSMGIRHIQDGASNTFLVVEAAKPVIWTKPEDLAFGNGPLPALGHCVEGVFHVCLVDGSSRVCGRSASPAELRRFIAPADGLINNHAALEVSGSLPVAKKSATVSGSVKLKGKPLTAGWVIFQMDDGREFASRIDANGKFKIAGVPFGLCKIVVQPGDPLEGWLDNPAQSPKKESASVPPQYREEVLTPLQIRVTKAEETLELDLQ